MKKNLLSVLLAECVLYATQFLIIPLFYEDVYGTGNETLMVLGVTSVFITAAGMLIFTDKIRFWLPGILVYLLLILLYSPPGVYGIGLVGMNLDDMQAYYDPSDRYFGIAVVMVFVIVFQFATWCFVKLFRFFAKKLTNHQR